MSAFAVKAIVIQFFLFMYCTKNKNLKEEILIFVKKRYNTTPIYPWPKIPSACTLKVNDKW